MLGVKTQGLYLYVWFLVKLLHNCYHLWRLLLILFLALLLVSVLVSCRHDVIHSKGGSSQDIFKNFLNLRLQNTNLEVDLQHIHFHLRIPNATVRRKYHVSPIIECFFFFLRNSLKSKVESILGQNPESRYFPGAKGCGGHVL